MVTDGSRFRATGFCIETDDDFVLGGPFMESSGNAGAKLAETVASKGVLAMMTRTSQIQLLRSFGFCLGEQRR